MKYSLILVMLLAACAKQDVPVKQRAPLSDKQISTKTHELKDGELIVMQVPVTQLDHVTEHQTCYMWRDKELRSTSLQCPNDRQSFSIDNE